MLQVTETGAQELQDKLRRFSADLRNPRAFITMGQLLSERAVRRNFQDAKDVNGKAWPKLKYRQGTPLVDKQGRMPKGITSQPEGTGWRVAAGSATAAFNAVHNFGSKLWWSGVSAVKKTRTGPGVGIRAGSAAYVSGGRKGIPQRQFMYLSKSAIQVIVANLKDYVLRQL